MRLKANRINAFEVIPAAMNAVMGIEAYISSAELEAPLIELVRMRVSQINGCAFCLDRHSKEARVKGETEQRLYLLNAWCDSSVYSARERAALAWAESLTLISESSAPDNAFKDVRAHFNDEELSNLTLVITQTNTWNRFATGFRYQHG